VPEALRERAGRRVAAAHDLGEQRDRIEEDGAARAASLG
jgi:hypothetical protein